MGGEVVSTPRLLLRPWRESDREAFAAMNANPEVRRFFQGRLRREESDALIERYEAERRVFGYATWALERRGDGALVGSGGLARLAEGMPRAPGVQLGWLLGREYWGRGYATEAARASMEYGFTRLDLAEVVAVTAVINAPSRRVMERLGMRRRPREDFDHPLIDERSPLRAHVLYRTLASDFRPLPA